MNRKTILALLLALAMLFTLSACGDKEPEPQQTEANTTQQTTEKPAGQAPADSGPVRVSSVQDLLEAVRPGAHIIVETGSYNMSDFLEADLKTGYEKWNETHEYVKVEECHDGLEVVIRNLDGLTIAGAGESPTETELVVEPRYAAVLNFVECQNIDLSQLMLGHTEAGDCSGPVLYLNNCRHVDLSAMDLYGCGVTGLSCDNGTTNVSVYMSDIHDCTEGELELFDCRGQFYFNNCDFYGCSSIGYIGTENADVTFEECSFDAAESYDLLGRDDIEFLNCYWDPDVVGGDPEPPVFDPESWEPWDGGEEFMKETLWYTWAKVDPENGETVDLDYDSDDAFTLVFDADGTGTMTERGEDLAFEWEMLSESEGTLQFEDRTPLYFTLYSEPENDEAYVWIMLEYSSDIYWLY